MGFTSFRSLWSGAGRGAGSDMVMWGMMSMLSLGSIVGCGVEQPVEDGSELQSVSKAIQEDNGLSLNGLSLNGLSLKGLSTPDFASWFIGADGGNVTGHDMLMRYLVRCAVPAGHTREFTNPYTKRIYVWEGGLGLAPNWASDHQATEDEEQIVTACLAAHVNNYGVHVPISVLGKNADDSVIDYSVEELNDFSQQEACFFGNLFRGEPKLYAGNYDAKLSPDQSTPRACGLTVEGQEHMTVAACSQMQRIGMCRSRCLMNGNGTFFETCTIGGKAYRPITTRIRPDAVNTCGDGICQLGERRGSGFTADSCKRDCGE